MLSTDLRSVPASTAIADAALWPSRPAIASTGRPGTARSAAPEAHAKRQGSRYDAARRTRLARRKPAVDTDERSPVPRAFVLQHASQFTPTGVANRPGQGVVRHHAAHVQVLYRDHLVFTNETGAQFMQIIAANIRNLLVDLGHPELCLAPILRAFPFAGQRLLRDR